MSNDDLSSVLTSFHRLMKILIVDDHPILRAGVAKLLQQAGENMVVIQSSSADEAMRLLDQHLDLDVVLLDLTLKGIDGREAIAEFGKIRPELPIVVLSASESLRDVRDAFAHGALGYVPKTSGLQTLLAAIKMALDGERYVPPVILDHQVLQDSSMVRGQPSARMTVSLTQRQIEVLRYVADGVPNKVIADKMSLSEKTVKAHITSIFRALNVINRTQAAAAGRKAGLI
ncbi:LuxR family transcriptional regulator [Burkholderia paludis]|uniref:LuxR family transcriptional regulator n=2 Tax=Burkholderiaceae TaxID=119060 RepID=A0A6J5DI04_9BURK|nr:Transcriptional regulatory protein DegU [Burkholderia paludis]VWB95254.1 LuxR family transcriptional regulator [Burkholderia paludis]